MDFNELLSGHLSAFPAEAEETPKAGKRKRERPSAKAVGQLPSAADDRPKGLDMGLYLRTRSELESRAAGQTAPAESDSLHQRELVAVQAAMSHLKRWEPFAECPCGTPAELTELEIRRLSAGPPLRPGGLTDDVVYQFGQVPGKTQVEAEMQITRSHPASVRYRRQLALVDSARYLVSNVIRGTVLRCGSARQSEDPAAPPLLPPTAQPAGQSVHLYDGMDTNVDDLLA